MCDLESWGRREESVLFCDVREGKVTFDFCVVRKLLGVDTVLRRPRSGVKLISMKFVPFCIQNVQVSLCLLGQLHLKVADSPASAPIFAPRSPKLSFPVQVR